MKKFLSILTCLVIVFSVFAGCSTRSLDSKVENITYSQNSLKEDYFKKSKSTLSKNKEGTTEAEKNEESTTLKSSKTSTKKAKNVSSKISGKSNVSTKSSNINSTNKSTISSINKTSTAIKTSVSRNSNFSANKTTKSVTQSYNSVSYDITKAVSTSQIADTTTTSTTHITTTSRNSCTIKIECTKILNNEKKLKEGHESFVPSNGIILNTYVVDINDDNTTVYDVLKKACEDNNIKLSAKTTSYGVYISGINNIDEFDCGSQSGWIYTINDKYPNVGVSKKLVSKGDKIVFEYTC